MRVISGTARGRRLKAPAGFHTRPLTDRIKEALFNIIGPNLPGVRFLDLFAGSGSVGIEALSRGAVQVIFIDNQSNAVATIYQNLERCGFIGSFEVYRNDVLKALPILKRRGLVFDYIYADPPFSVPHLFMTTVQALDRISILDQEGTLIIRVPRREVLPETLKDLQAFRWDRYGESTLVYYKHRNRGESQDGAL